MATMPDLTVTVRPPAVEILYEDTGGVNLYDNQWDAMALRRPLVEEDRGKIVHVFLTWEIAPTDGGGVGETEFWLAAGTLLDMLPVSTKPDEIGTQTIAGPGYAIPGPDMRGAAVLRVAVPEPWDPNQEALRFMVVASDRLSEYRGLRRRVCIL